MKEHWCQILILAPNWSKIAAKFFFVGLCHSSLIYLGPLGHQQQHPTVHSGGVSRVPCNKIYPGLLSVGLYSDLSRLSKSKIFCATNISVQKFCANKSGQKPKKKCPKKVKQWLIVQFCVQKPKPCPISEKCCATVGSHGLTFEKLWTSIGSLH